MTNLQNRAVHPENLAVHPYLFLNDAANLLICLTTSKQH